jgi:hypothetical protein
MDDTIDYLVLADTVIVLDHGDKLTIVTDDRVSQVAEEAHAETRRHTVGSPEHARAVSQLSRTQRQSRNHPGGYWVAAADPVAARQARTGSTMPDQVRRAAVLTDGASRLVDSFGVATWDQLLDQLATEGPARLIARVRELERSDLAGARWPRYKASDDATAVYMGSMRYTSLLPD